MYLDAFHKVISLTLGDEFGIDPLSLWNVFTLNDVNKINYSKE